MKSISRTFLLVDDDNDDRELFNEALSSIDTSIVVYVTENGKEALDRLGEIRDLPRLIFLDVNMPVMNGWDCLKSLKEDSRYKHIPVIMYSTSSLPQDIDKAMACGACCFFVKPDSYDDLMRVLSLITKNMYGLDTLKESLSKNELKPFIHFNGSKYCA